MTSSSTNHATHGRLQVDNQGQGVAPPREYHVSAFLADPDAPRYYSGSSQTTQSELSGHHSPNRRSAYDRNYDDGHNDDELPDFSKPWDQHPPVYFRSFSYGQQYNAIDSAPGSGPYQENTDYYRSLLYPPSTATSGGTTQFPERFFEDDGMDYLHLGGMPNHPTDFIGVGAFVADSIAQPIHQVRINAAPQVTLPRTSEQRPSSNSANDEVPTMPTPTAPSPVRQTFPLHLRSPGTRTTLYTCTEPGCGKFYKSASGFSKHKMKHLRIIVRCGHPGCNYESYRTDQTRVHFKKTHPRVNVPLHLERKTRGKTQR
ncbi:hypothetical protein QBC43DRAFT_119585 [Cladorrhinum sp. PSN259]|nr:hypothetical protein QBC43DRAFT_119585 [Cladorrhinum sp. PSN259]